MLKHSSDTLRQVLALAATAGETGVASWALCGGRGNDSWGGLWVAEADADVPSADVCVGALTLDTGCTTGATRLELTIPVGGTGG